MFNLELEKPKTLTLGNNDDLAHVKLEELKPQLFKNKTYARKRKEYKDLLNINTSDMISTRIEK